MITAEKVKALNKKIEDQNAKSTRAKAKVEVLEGTLEKALEDYQTIYGVSLKGKSMAETIRNIQKELGIVGQEVEKEFELRNAVVEAIECGDIAEANRLLGVEVEDAEEEATEVADSQEEGDIIPDVDAVEDSEEEATEVADSQEEGDILPDVNAVKDKEPTPSMGHMAAGAFDFYSKISSMLNDAEAEPEEGPETFSFGGISLGSIDDEDDDEPVVTPKKTEPVKKGKKAAGNKFSNLGGSVSDAVSELEGDSFEDFNISDSEFEDFGLGKLLSGSKFEID